MYKCSYDYLVDYSFPKVTKSDSLRNRVNLGRLAKGEYLHYINLHSELSRRYSIILARIDGIYEIRKVDDLSNMCLVINIDLIHEFIHTLDIDILDTIIYAINNSDSRNFNEVNKLYLASKKHK